MHGSQVTGQRRLPPQLTIDGGIPAPHGTVAPFVRSDANARPQLAAPLAADAFFAAAHRREFDALVAMLDSDVVLRSDADNDAWEMQTWGRRLT